MMFTKQKTVTAMLLVLGMAAFGGGLSQQTKGDDGDRKRAQQHLGDITPPVPDVIWRRLGMSLKPLAAKDVARINPQLHGGLIIAEVRASGSADKAGIKRGDILVGLHQWEMLNLENVKFVLNHPDLATFTPLRFYTLRDGKVQRGCLQTLD